MYRNIATALCVFTMIGCDSASIDQTTQDELVGSLPGISRMAIEQGVFGIPGTIEAEDYLSQSGIRLGQTSDSGGSDFVGHIENNDYTEYFINVPSSGEYRLTARVASRNRTAEVAFLANGRVAGNLTVTPTGGWDEWETVTSTLALSSGNQTLRLAFSGSGPGLMNINWFSLETTSSTPENEKPPENETTDNDEVDNSNWIVYSNFNDDDARLAIDGSDSTRWTTRSRQSDGQEFFIDMQGRNEFDRIILDSVRSRNDYPRQYSVGVSNNGSNWTEVAAGTGSLNGNTVIDFADQNASHVRISQSGSSNKYWWSIQEISVFANSSDITGFNPPEDDPENVPTNPPANPPTNPPANPPANPPTNPPGTHEDIVRVIDVQGRNPGGVSWADSYSVGDQCYIFSNFDHGIGNVSVDTPRGRMRIRDLYDLMPRGPGISGRPIYNDIQCGNGPANTASDETDCPGRVDIGRSGCGHIGPKWDLSRI